VTEYFIGQLVVAGYDFVPRGQAACNGATLPINQYQALFALLGTYYGGNGSSNFKLPDLRGRIPVGYAASRDPSWQPPLEPIGATGGVESVTLTTGQMGMHSHVPQGSSQTAALRAPNTKSVFAGTGQATLNPYGPDSGTLVGLAAPTLGNAGQGAAHPNVQPLSTLNFNIALSGIWPSRN
jgi:microcystin-dependent protein